MDAGHLVRAARRRAGLSQRSMEQRSGVARSTISRIEAGQQRASAVLVDRLLAAADLDVILAERLRPSETAELRRHLRLSLTQRLRLGLGESPAVQAPGRTQVWAELLALSATARVVLEPPLAIACWIPCGVVSPVRVAVHSQPRLPSTSAVDVRQVDVAPAPSLIPVTLTLNRRVWVLPPAELAMPDATTALLRSADMLLHAHAPLDDADRRRPAHRDPQEWQEQWRLLVTKGTDRLPQPDGRLSRGWRLGAPASLAQLLREGGTLPP